MPKTPQQEGVVQDQLSIKELIKSVRKLHTYLLSKKRKIIITSCIGVVLGVIISIFSPPTYTAQTSFILETTKKSGLGDYSSIAAKFGVSTGGSGGLFNQDENIIALLQSRKMISKTFLTEEEFEEGKDLLINRFVQTLELKEKWGKNERILNALNFQVDSVKRTILQDSLIGVLNKILLKGTLSVNKPDKEESIIVITTKSTDEQFAYKFNKALLENVTDYYIKIQTQRQTENVLILESQIDSVQQLLNTALAEMAMSTDANPNLNPAYQRLKVNAQKRLVEIEMYKAALEELSKSLGIARINLRKEMPLVQIIDEPVLPLERKKFGILKGIFFGGLIGLLLSLLYFSTKIYLQKLINE